MTRPKHTRLPIRPELSAQGIRKRPNPMLSKVIEALRCEHGLNGNSQLTVDCGCGQLRNVQTLLDLTRNLVLVDTPYQLTTQHDFYGEKLRVDELVERKWPAANIRVIDAPAFGSSRLNADVIFIINVLDVTPRETRRQIIEACRQNLQPDGRLAVIAPRNDTWTMRICTPDKKYQDGFIFPHARGFTYYRNWPGESLHNDLARRGFRVISDFSIHRQVCLICSKDGK